MACWMLVSMFPWLHPCKSCSKAFHTIQTGTTYFYSGSLYVSLHKRAHFLSELQSVDLDFRQDTVWDLGLSKVGEHWSEITSFAHTVAILKKIPQNELNSGCCADRRLEFASLFDGFLSEFITLVHFQAVSTPSIRGVAVHEASFDFYPVWFIALMCVMVTEFFMFLIFSCMTSTVSLLIPLLWRVYALYSCVLD